MSWLSSDSEIQLNVVYDSRGRCIDLEIAVENGGYAGTRLDAPEARELVQALAQAIAFTERTHGVERFDSPAEMHQAIQDAQQPQPVLYDQDAVEPGD